MILEQNMNKTMSLNGEWILGYGKENREIVSFSDVCEMYDTVKAQVPGNFELDLKANNIIKDEFFGMATMENQKWEPYYKYYSRKFSVTDTDQELVFQGLDTICYIYLNGEFLAYTDNMFVEHIFDVSEKLKIGENEIVVKFCPTYSEAAKYDYPLFSNTHAIGFEALTVRKAASSFGWDIMPRTVSCGIWRDVYLQEKKKERIDTVYAVTWGIKDNTAEVLFYFRGKIDWPYGEDIYELDISAECDDSVISVRKKLRFGGIRFGVSVENPKLWWPKGSGPANLYKGVAKLIKNGSVIDTYDLQFGIRTVDLERTDHTDRDGRGEFVFRINGKKIFCKGTNWVPMDAFHSRDRERIPKALEMAKDLNCNVIRVWGGGVYEDNLFYEICDREGFMVWQDFAMACGVYPQNPEFMEKMKTEVTKAVRRLRQHPSVILWSGDNECDQTANNQHPLADPEMNAITRDLIPHVLNMEDPARPYLPSSPYTKFNNHKFGERASEGHPWGPRDYFKGKFYSEQIYHFASEIGYHGMPNTESLKKFISPEKLNDRMSDEWTLHCSAPDMDDEYIYRNRLMENQVREFFGFVPDDLAEFTVASQISQAEAKKFFVEMFRSRKWRRTGLIWWNLIDGWPQISDAIVDYYYGKKLAYQYIKASQQDLCLMFREPEAWHIELVGANDTFKDMNVEYKAVDLKTGETVCQGRKTADADSVTHFETLPYTMSRKTIYKIEWHGDAEGVNHYLTGQPVYDLKEYIELAKQIYNIEM